MIPRAPLSDQVHERILDSIDSGDLVPGDRLRDAAIASELGVSRTPVREALIRLTREGVLESDMGRGFRVRPLTLEEISEIGAILGTLESLALRRCPDFGTPQIHRLEDLDRRLEQVRGDVRLCLDLEDEWHRLLLEECPNRRLLAFIVELRRIPRRYLSAYLREAGRLSLSTLPHAKLLDALGRRDRETASQIFEHHWRRGVEALCAWVGRGPEPGKQGTP